MSWQRGDCPLHLHLYFRPGTIRYVLPRSVAVFCALRVDPLEGRRGGWYTITLSRLLNVLLRLLIGATCQLPLSYLRMTYDFMCSCYLAEPAETIEIVILSKIIDVLGQPILIPLDPIGYFNTTLPH
jgi:hypothetical protein